MLENEAHDELNEELVPEVHTEEPILEEEAVEEVIRFITGKKLEGKVPEVEYEVQRNRL